MKIQVIPCLQDNYAYIIIDEANKTACVIDPSESEPVINFLEKNNIKLKFVSNLGKFENLDNFETPFEYQSKINKDSLKVNPDQAFESGGYRDDNEGMPF